MTEEKKMKIVHNEKEYEFLPSELSNESKAQFQRANQIGAACVQLEQDLMEKRFLLNNYVGFVVNELDSKESDIKTLDSDEKK
tara:strand:+ start:168 stop:416 length:249 start_codon:yes stop_codon:yes gene_type:complete